MKALKNLTLLLLH